MKYEEWKEQVSKELPKRHSIAEREESKLAIAYAQGCTPRQMAYAIYGNTSWKNVDTNGNIK